MKECNAPTITTIIAPSRRHGKPMESPLIQKLGVVRWATLHYGLRVAVRTAVDWHFHLHGRCPTEDEVAALTTALEQSALHENDALNAIAEGADRLTAVRADDDARLAAMMDLAKAKLVQADAMLSEVTRLRDELAVKAAA